MPFLQEETLIFDDDLPDLRQLMVAEASIVGQGGRLEPELRIAARMGNMDMWWLASFETVEKEPVATYSQDGRHLTSLPHRASCAKSRTASPSVSKVA
jgi:hypothetical protein